MGFFHKICVIVLTKTEMAIFFARPCWKGLQRVLLFIVIFNRISLMMYNEVKRSLVK